ncbi:hypothetical protein BMG_5778 (plasmid) [Priestia megaterium]|nr:hypothetical protein BMG_5778 [Priestia megaterium]
MFIPLKYVQGMKVFILKLEKLLKAFLSIIRQLRFIERKKPLTRFSDFFLLFMDGRFLGF